MAEVKVLAKSWLMARGETRPSEAPGRAGHGIRNLPEVAREAIELVNQDEALATLNYTTVCADAVKKFTTSDFGDVEVEVLTTLIQTIRPNFLQNACETLKKIIEDKPRDLQRLDRLISSVASEARAQGFSDEALARFTLDESAPDLAGALIEFRSKLTTTKVEYQSRVAVEFGSLGSEWLVRVPELELDEDGKHVIVKIVARDDVSAARRAVTGVSAVLGATSVYADTPALVDSTKPIVVTGPNETFEHPGVEPLAIEKRRAAQDQVVDLANRVWGTFIRSDSDPLHQAVRLHERASRTSDIETRFVLLWFSIERLVAGSQAYSSIEQAVRRLVPGAVVLAKIRRDLSAFSGAIEAKIQAEHLHTLHGRWGLRHPLHGATVFDRRKLLEALLAPDTEGYDELKTSLLTWWYPLFVHRLNMFRRVFEPGDERGKRIAKHLEKSLTRTSRQVTRLYRTRNRIAHGGSQPERLHELTRHANFYVTNLIGIAAHQRRKGDDRLPSAMYAERAGQLEAFLATLRSGVERAQKPQYLERPAQLQR